MMCERHQTHTHSVKTQGERCFVLFESIHISLSSYTYDSLTLRAFLFTSVKINHKKFNKLLSFSSFMSQDGRWGLLGVTQPH